MYIITVQSQIIFLKDFLKYMLDPYYDELEQKHEKQEKSPKCYPLHRFLDLKS